MQTRFRSLTRTAAFRPRARFSPVPRLFLSILPFRQTRYAPPPAQRHPYSSSSVPTSTSFRDPARPDLHYHLVDPPTPLSSKLPSFALSFLPSPPSNGSSTVVGWLPAATTANDDEAGLNDFVENREPIYLRTGRRTNRILTSLAKFRALLHNAIQDGLKEGVDDIQINGATQLGNGWMHVHGPPLLNVFLLPRN